MKKSTRITCALLTAALALSQGCGKVATVTVTNADGTTSSVGVNINGQVTSTSRLMTARSPFGGVVRDESTIKIFGSQLARQSERDDDLIRATAVSGCTVSVYEIDGTTALATGTTDSSGTYTITGGALESGKSYKVVADCGTGEKYAAINTADSVEPKNKTPELTNPLTTLIAAEVIKSMLLALEESVAGVDASIKDIVKAAVKKVLPTIVAAIKATIEEAIKNGTMSSPTSESAKDMAGDLAGADTSTKAGTAAGKYKDADCAAAGGGCAGSSVPDAVSGAANSATKAASALPACDVSLNVNGQTPATLSLCTRAMAKVFYGLGFGVLLNKTSGVFGPIACTAGGIGTHFPDAKFEDAPDPDGAGSAPVITDGCFIKHRTSEVDRNRGYEDGGGNGGDDGPIFAETIGTVFPVGLITKIGAAMFAGNKQILNDIDKMMFSTSGTGDTQAGLNLRLLLRQHSFSTGGGSFNETQKYMDSAGAWQPLLCDDDNSAGTADVACDFRKAFSHETGSKGFTDHTWGSSNKDTTGATMATRGNDVGAGDFVGKVFPNMYRGPVPDQAKLESFFNERTHTGHNPTGPKEFYVLYAQKQIWLQPDSNNSAHCGDSDPTTPCKNGCFDGDTATACYGADGTTTYPALRVNFTLGTATSTGDTKGYRPIATMTGSTTGAFYLRPLHGNSGWSGGMEVVSFANGRTVLDELQRPRRIFRRTTLNSNPSGLTLTDGQIANVDATWSCSGNNGCSAAFAAITGATGLITGLAISVDTNYKNRWQEFHGGSNKFGWNLLTVGNGDFNNVPRLVVTLDGTTGAITAVRSDNGTPLATGASPEAYMGSQYACPSGVCALAGFVPIKSDGQPLEISGLGTTSCNTAACNWDGNNIGANTSVCWPRANGTFSCSANVVKWNSAYLATLTGIDFDTNIGGTTSFANATSNIQVDQGPVINTNFRCSFEPYYVETGTENNALDCDSANTAAANGDVTFGNIWEWQNWKMRPENSTHASKAMKRNPNGYKFANPIGVKNLMNTAFPGWFDGQHTISASTTFTPLQTFALIFLFFEGKGEDGLHVEGLLPAGTPGALTDESPIFRQAGTDEVRQMKLFNIAIGNGFAAFKQP